MDSISMDAKELEMMALSLYHSTHQGYWKEALTTLRRNPGIHEMPINSSGDTLLHVALNDKKDEWAEEIVDEIKKYQSWSALGTKNNRGDTPLHCAASIGSLKMCVAIAEAQVRGGNTLMVEARNEKGETPLFLAALHGHKDAFLYLHILCPDQSRRLWKRAGDGETVLHCTIRREHFDLAFHSILMYKDDIVGSVDEKGITPLHILASKPSAFEKSSNFRWYNKLVYNCLIVKPLMGIPEQQYNNDTLPNWWKKSAQKTQTGGGENVTVRMMVAMVQRAIDLYIGPSQGKLRGYGATNQQKAGAEGKENSGTDRRESALFIATRNGVLEIVTKILRDIPGAIRETNSQGQSVLHVAVERRQPYIIEILKKDKWWDGLIQSLDNDGNSILHVVAKTEFQIQGSSALEMQHGINWYEYVKSMVPLYVTFLPNNEEETPEEIFLRDHKDLAQKSDEWLCRTSESCSVVAALVAGVAFATSSTVPGGNDDKTGKPTLEGQPGFDVFAISALIALCFSVTALILFLSILTSRKHPADFMKKLPVKLFIALSSLFVSICSMFISFCAAHSFVLEGKSMKSVLLLYAIICLPVSFTIVEFPLYMDLFKGTFMKIQPPYNLKRI
ncbi:hypothetical protein QN277_011713 [Acacia crassicarpa]|uniref:PGG domain-containing protein n=1 Tax=Acacia crassicarpa TaxID=499986 RepID=A0AAE1MYZ6_9FABA|nr:hypothetical protein QN277_011713 [Acacia crassicarpa]